MSRLCPCGQGKARKVLCVCEPAPRLCESCTLTHRCPSLEHIDVKAWRAANAPEETLTAALLTSLGKLPGVVAWQGKRRGGVRAGADAKIGLPDICGFVEPDGRAFGIETKGSHPPTCKCDSCEGQRKWGARLVMAGGVYVSDVRSVAEGVDGLLRGLAFVRGRAA